MTLVSLDSNRERELIHDLRDAAEAWLTDRGYDQYQGPRREAAHADIDRLFDSGNFFGWRDGDRVVAVVAVTEPDMDFWTAEQAREPQTYITRFLARDHGGGYGAALLDAMIDRARSLGHRWVRLDCWKTNTDLHAYYLSRGFQQLPIVEVPGRMSGAIFQFGPLTDSCQSPFPPGDRS